MDAYGEPQGAKNCLCAGSARAFRTLRCPALFAADAVGNQYGRGIEFVMPAGKRAPKWRFNSAPTADNGKRRRQPQCAGGSRFHLIPKASGDEHAARTLL